MTEKLQGFHRKLYLTRYAKKSKDKRQDIAIGGLVVTLVKDGKFPVREVGTVHSINGDMITVKLETADGFEHQVGELFTQDIALIDVLLETEYEQTADRVALALASVEHTKAKQDESYRRFKEAIENFYLVPSGRILNGAGDDTQVTLFNCYVTDVIEPPYAKGVGVDSRQAIFHHMGRVSEIMARGGGNGTCLSVFRPRYAPLSKTKGQSAGSVYIGNQISGLTDFVNQGNRRGAQMLTQFIWHPDVFYTNDQNDPNFVEDFIGAKRKPGFMEGNNSSILITDDFMTAVENDDNWSFVFPDTKHEKYNAEWDGDLDKWLDKGYPVITYRTVKAREVWDKIMTSNWASAEPGIIFIDTVNKQHNGWYLGKVKATNPCGEQPILGNSTCNLSAINFGRMIKVVGEDELGLIYDIDWVLLGETIQTGVRFLDNAIDTTFYFNEDMKAWQQGERRVGLGGMGVADLLIALRLPYGSKEGNEVLDKLFKYMRNVSYATSIELAIEKGPFPFFDDKKYMQSGFIKQLPEELQHDIRNFGIRNLTLNTFAPTGTTGSMTPSLLDINGSVSTGIEPHFAMKYNRLSRIGSTTQYAGVAKVFMDEHPGMELPNWFVGAMDLPPLSHVSVQAIAQKYIDSSISKTVNAPKDYTVEQCAEVYMQLYKQGCKGGTIYRDGSRDTQILSLEDNNEEVENEAPKEEKVMKGKYDDWSCPSCGHTDFELVENCPKCKQCGTQACSI